MAEETTPITTAHRKGLSDFFRDAKGNFSMFTVVGFFACLALIYIGVTEVRHAYTVQTEIIWGFIFMYCVNTLSDSLLGAVIARGFWRTPPSPDTVINADVKTDAVNISEADDTDEKEAE